jgi:chromosome segregation ATPase
MRSGYHDLAAKGLMTFEELEEKLRGLEETRKTAERELEALRSRRERVEELEQDKETLLESYLPWRRRRWIAFCQRSAIRCTRCSGSG